MASLSDSKAHFAQRATEYGVPDGLVDMRLARVTIMADLAFAICRSGQDFEKEEFEQWITNINGHLAWVALQQSEVSTSNQK